MLSHTSEGRLLLGAQPKRPEFLSDQKQLEQPRCIQLPVNHSQLNITGAELEPNWCLTRHLAKNIHVQSLTIKPWVQHSSNQSHTEFGRKPHIGTNVCGCDAHVIDRHHILLLWFSPLISLGA